MASKENQEALEHLKTCLNENGSYYKNFTSSFQPFMEDIGTLQQAIDDLELLQQQKQISDVEKIADNEREMNAIEKISKLEKALDKACECLVWEDNPPKPYKSWKEYLLKESENDNENTKK